MLCGWVGRQPAVCEQLPDDTVPTEPPAATRQQQRSTQESVAAGSWRMLRAYRVFTRSIGLETSDSCTSLSTEWDVFGSTPRSRSSETIFRLLSRLFAVIARESGLSPSSLKKCGSAPRLSSKYCTAAVSPFLIRSSSRLRRSWSRDNPGWARRRNLLCCSAQNREICSLSLSSPSPSGWWQYPSSGRNKSAKSSATSDRPISLGDTDRLFLELRLAMYGWRAPNRSSATLVVRLSRGRFTRP